MASYVSSPSVAMVSSAPGAAAPPPGVVTPAGMAAPTLAPPVSISAPPLLSSPLGALAPSASGATFPGMPSTAMTSPTAVRTYRVTPGDPVVVRAESHSTQVVAELASGAVVCGHVKGECLCLSTGGVAKLKYLAPLDPAG